MILPISVAKEIIKKLINGQDYRILVVALLNANFLKYTIEFFKKVVEAKLKNKGITIDWYKKEFLNPTLNSKDIAINSGLNLKTISNMYNTGRREIVIESSNIHYETLSKVIEDLIESTHGIDITLSIKLNGVSVELNISESLIVINTLAVKRAQLRGGLWSTAGKRVEKPLMLTLCKLFGVEETYYRVKVENNVVDPFIGFEREVDFYLVKPDTQEEFKCEVKLMGKGNPESADAVIARDSKVFIADKLSTTNKNQLDSLNIEWVEMRTHDGYRKFANVLSELKIPFRNFTGDPNSQLETIFSQIFPYS
jgi:hypothetical protein